VTPAANLSLLSQLSHLDLMLSLRVILSKLLDKHYVSENYDNRAILVILAGLV